MRTHRLSLAVLAFVFLLLFTGQRLASASGGEAVRARPSLLPDAASLNLQTGPITPTLALVGPTVPQPVTSTIAVSVVISSATDVAGFEADLEYDRSLVDLLSVELSSALGNPDPACDSSATRCAAPLGPLSRLTGASVGAYSFGPGAGVSGEATLATLYFQPTGASGTTAVNVQNALVSDAGGSLTVPDVQGTTLTLIRREPTADFLPSKKLNPLSLEDGASVNAFSSVYNSSSSYRPENAIDRHSSSAWLTGYNQPNDQWLRVETMNGALFVLDRVTLRGNSGTAGIKDFEIRISTTTADPGAFQTVFAGTVPNDTSSHDFTFPPVQARYVELYVVNNWGYPYYTQVYNFQAWTRERDDGIVSLLEGPPATVAAFSSRYSSSGSYRPENAIDANLNTYWRTGSGQTTDQWLTVELGGGRTYTIDEVLLRSYTTATAVRNFEIRVSTTTLDDAAFTTVFSGVAVQDNSLQEFSFAPVAARYIQLRILDSYGTSYIQLAAFQALAPDGANMARLEGVGAFIMDASSQYSNSYPPERAIDYSTGTYWITGSGANFNQWIKVRLLGGQSHLIDRVLLQGNTGSYTPRNVEIRVSNTGLDDADFVTVYAGTLPNDGQPHWLLFRPVQAKYVQLYIVDGYGGAYLYVRDFKVFTPAIGGLVVPFDDFSTDSDGQLVSWSWDFGDGATSSERHPEHIYATPGTYPIQLTVTDDDGLTNSASFTYSALQPPTAAFSYSPLAPTEGQTVYLTDASTSPEGPLVAWLWQYSHTTSSSSSQNSAVAFPDNGVYTVTLTVIDNQLLTASTEQAITTINAPPTAYAGSDRTVVIGQDWATNANASDPGAGDRPTLECYWDFGDGQTQTISGCGYSSSVRVPHAYTQAGTYTASLTVSDKDGASTTDTAVITVVNRSSQVIIFGARSTSASTAELRAGLYDVLNWDNVMSGRTIEFSWSGQTVSAVTDANGIATATAPLALGSEVTVTASFAGDATYYGSSDTNVIRVATNLPQGDIVFMIDESGSMGDDQAEVRNRLNAIVTQLGYAIDTRLGLVGYGAGFGTNYNGEPRIVSTLTDDTAAFSAALGSLVTSGGFEPGFAATIVGMSEAMGFREGAGVCAIIITDEDADRGTTYANETREDALAALNERNATFLGIVSPGSGNTANHYGPNPGSLAEATGGEVFSIINFRANPGPVLAAIIDRCAEAIAQRVPPDLALSKTDGNDAVAAGTVFTYSIGINNVSIQDATGVLLTDTLPAHISFLSASDGGTENGGIVTWPPFTVPFGTIVTRTVTVQSSSILPAGVATITNTVRAFDDGVNGPDPTPDDNSAADTTTLLAAPDLSLAKDDGGIEVMTDDVIAYWLTYANGGTQEATGALITETVPAYTTFHAPLSSPGWSCADGAVPGTVCTYNLGNLPVGASGLITFSVSVTGTLPLTVTAIGNTAAIDDDGSNGADLNPADNIASDTTPIITPITECDLYPIALHQDTLANVVAGDILNIYNGANPGNFGWLTWDGANNVVALVNALTQPGTADTYTNPYDASDHVATIGDWVQGRPGVGNGNGVRQALDILTGVEIVVPVWDLVDQSGANTLYRIVDFARVEIVSYQLSNQNSISASFVGYATCSNAGTLELISEPIVYDPIKYPIITDPLWPVEY